MIFIKSKGSFSALNLSFLWLFSTEGIYSVSIFEKKSKKFMSEELNGFC